MTELRTPPAAMTLGLDTRVALGPLGLDPFLPSGAALHTSDGRDALALTAFFALAGQLGLRFAIVDLDLRRPGASAAEVVGLFVAARAAAAWPCEVISVQRAAAEDDAQRRAHTDEAAATLRAGVGDAWTTALVAPRAGACAQADVDDAAACATQIGAVHAVATGLALDGCLLGRDDASIAIAAAIGGHSVGLHAVGLLAAGARRDQASSSALGDAAGWIGVDSPHAADLAPALAAHRDLAAIARRTGASWQRVAFAYALRVQFGRRYAVSTASAAVLRDAVAARHLTLDDAAMATLAKLDPDAPGG